MFEKEAEEYLMNHFCKKVDEELIIGECDRGERTRCAEFEARKEMLIEFAKQKTEALREEVEDLKSDHEHNLGLMKGLNERIAELNKANEWHYVKDKLPPSGETVLFYFGIDIMGKAVICTGCVDCKGEWYKSVDKEPIKWQEIVLSEPKEYE